MSIFKKQNITAVDDKTPVKFRRREKLLQNNPEKKKKRHIKRYVILAIVLAILGVGGYFGFKTYSSLEGMFANGSGILNLFNGNPNTSYLKGESNGRVNILLLGIGDEGHGGANLTDTMIVASYDVKTKAVAMFSIPRDLYVKVPKDGYEKINAVHAYAEQKKEGTGPAASEEVVSSIFDIPIHYYVRVDFSGLSEIVDSLGGVTVDVENTFCDYAYPTERKGDTSKVCFTAGKQQMNGLKALQYARSRHALGVEGSDFARSKRQQRLLAAIKEKAVSQSTLSNPKKVMDLLTALGKHIKTDLQANELLRCYELSKEVDGTKIINRNFDNSPTGLLQSVSGAAGYILQPVAGADNYKQIQAVVKNIFSMVAVRDEKASLAVYNGTTSTTVLKALVKDLTDEGFNVATNGAADNKNYKTTKIIDYSGGTKPETVKALEKMFGVTAVKETASTTTFEIKVIVGKDYL